MDRALYVAGSGAAQTLLSQQIATNNLANVNTPGFRADLNYFSSLYAEGAGHPARVLSQTESPFSDLKPGSLMKTDNELDIAIQGDGWLAVRGTDGKEAYTRVGNLKISPNGVLTTGSGYQVLGNGGPITIPPAEKIEIGKDGTISIRPLGQAANALAQLDRIKLVNPKANEMQKREDGLFQFQNGNVAPADPNVQVINGMLEGSNVNAVGEMTDMISLARQFEIQVKLMKHVEENAAASDRILQNRG